MTSILVAGLIGTTVGCVVGLGVSELITYVIEKKWPVK